MTMHLNATHLRARPTVGLVGGEKMQAVATAVTPLQSAVTFGTSVPTATWTVESFLPPSFLLKKLADNMDKEPPSYYLSQSGGRMYGIKRGSKAVTGEITGNKFRVMRWLKINNPHTPILEGEVLPNGTGSKIVAKFTLLESTQKWMDRLWPLTVPIDKLGRWLGTWDVEPLTQWLNGVAKA